MSFREKLSKAYHHPEKLSRYVRVLARSLPFKFRLTTWIPKGLYLSYAPDRYTTKLNEYQAAANHGFYDAESRAKWTKGNYVNNAGDLSRYYFLSLTCDQIIKEGLEGDVAELGVYKGNSAHLLARLARYLKRTAYLFDTFQSFDARDLDSNNLGIQDAFSDTSLETVKALTGEENIRFVEGYFPESLNQLPADPRFCLVHIDCDLYAPFKAALEYFYPRLVEGGFLIMHDYSSYYWDGVEQAVDEFFADKPEKPILIPDKSGSAVIRKIRKPSSP